jgi:hypothetical protein
LITEDGVGGISPPSNGLWVVLIAPPVAPAALTAAAADREVRLQWRPPSRLVGGGAPGPLGYEVLRATTADGPPEATFPVPAGQTAYVDRTVENERTYYYAVRALREEAGTAARGAPSPRVAATPGRATAPPPPTALVAALAADTVRLSWTASTDRSVAAYIVYRAAAGGQPGRIGSVRAPATTFTDRNLAPGTYRYTVTAQDATARANESVPSNEVSIAVP